MLLHSKTWRLRAQNAYKLTATMTREFSSRSRQPVAAPYIELQKELGISVITRGFRPLEIYDMALSQTEEATQKNVAACQSRRCQVLVQSSETFARKLLPQLGGCRQKKGRRARPKSGRFPKTRLPHAYTETRMILASGEL